MSDLQCPARLLFLPLAGIEQHALIDALRQERVSAVWAATRAEGAEVAGQLGVGVQVDARASDPEQLAALIEDIADTTRGETTLLLSSIGPLEVLVDGDGVHRRSWSPR